MYVHNYLTMNDEHEPESASDNGGIVYSFVSYMIGQKPKPFFYNIGGFNFDLEEMKHGILRNNKKAPQNYLQSLNKNDDKLNILPDFEDPRILFICLDYPQKIELMDNFSATTQEESDKEIDTYVYNALEGKVNIDIDQGEIILPKVF